MKPELLSAVHYPAACFSEVQRQSKEESLLEEGQNLDIQKEERGNGRREGCMEMLMQNYRE